MSRIGAGFAATLILIGAAFLYSGGMDTPPDKDVAEGIRASQSLVVDPHSPIGMIGQPVAVTFSTTQPGCSTTVTIFNKTTDPIFIGVDIDSGKHLTVKRNYPPNSMTPIEVTGSYRSITVALAGLKGVWEDTHPPLACKHSTQPISYHIGKHQDFPI